jgi:hypothetical protein
MVELFAGSSGMAIANQLTPPLGAYAKGADQGQCCRVLYYYANRLRKKLIKKLNNFILVFYKLSKSNAPEAMGSTPLHAPPPSHRLFHNSSILSSYFWLVVVCWFTNWRLIKATMYLIFIIICDTPFDTPNNGTSSSHTPHPSHASSISSHLPQMPTFGWLLHVAA